MGLPDPVRVKISSEAAGYVSLTPVVAQELPLRELLEYAASAAGADASRVAEILKRGSLVAAASRFRWEPLDARLEEVAARLAELPRPEPSRPFDESRCERAALLGKGVRVEFSRDTARQRRLLRRQSFWGELTAAVPAPAYVDYLYRERCDRYRSPLDAGQRAAIAAAARLLPHRGLALQVRTAAHEAVEFVVKRGGEEQPCVSDGSPTST
jgi:hypothetical protein